MKKITIILIAILSLGTIDLWAQPAIVQVYNKSNQSMTILPAGSNTLCTVQGPSSYVAPAGQISTFSLPLNINFVDMVRIHPIMCFIPSAIITLGSTCTPCNNGGLPSTNTLIGCNGNSYTATWIKCQLPGIGSPYQGNVILIE